MSTLPPPFPPTPPDDGAPLHRRDFLKVAGVGAGLLLVGACDSPESAVPGLKPKRRLPLVGGSSANIVVIGAGAWGSWTAYYLRRIGASVTLVDAYGPGNSRSTSGDETRGIRSSYGDRETGELWMQWARESIARWKAFDEEWGKDVKLNLFHPTGDLIMRADWDPFLTKTRALWEKYNVKHEVLTPDEVRKRWPVIQIDDIGAILAEPDAGVVRARRSVQAVTGIFESLGGKVVIGRVRTPKVGANGKIEAVELESGETLRADAFVFACGPWLGKTFPELLSNRMRTPMGYVCYFGTPPHDTRFEFPNLPSFNFPGVTGWPTLPVDSRGFRVRGGSRAPTGGANAAAGTGANGRGGGSGRGGAGTTGAATTPGAARTPVAGGAPTTAVGASARAGSEAPGTPPRVTRDTTSGRGGRDGRDGRGGRGAAGGAQTNPPRAPVPPAQLDPDTSDRWADPARLEGPRRFVAQRFPLLAEMPLLETRSCHYEQTSSSNFIIDQHPQMSNVWIAGGGNAEGFKFGPVVGEYIAQRVLGEVGDPKIAEGFRIPKDEYAAPSGS